MRAKLLGIAPQGLGFDSHASHDAQPEPIRPVQERSGAGMVAKPLSSATITTSDLPYCTEPLPKVQTAS